MNYDANSIQTLSFVDAIRTRIAMYMGSADNAGVLQCVREIITNSIDEATMGFGKKITVTLDGNTVTVEDEGRGVPFGVRESDGIDAIVAIYTMPHSGGKFDNKTYQNVAGMNGIGAKGTALSSDYFSAQSTRDGRTCTLIVENGKVTSLTTVKATSTKTGTKVTFTPSQEVYKLEPIHINFSDLKEMCKNWSYLSSGIEFALEDKKTKEKVKYLSKNGINDFIKDNAVPLHKTPLYIKMEENGIKCEVAAFWTKERHEKSFTFTNGLANPEGGTSLTGVKTALTTFFKKHINDTVSPDVARTGLFYVVNCQVPNPSFANQTKTKVNNPELRGLCQRATGKMLDEFSKRHTDEFNRIISMLTKEAKAEIAAEKARAQILKAEKDIGSNQKKKVFASDKLKDAEVLGEKSTLLLVEGNSAASSLANARTNDFGILALRGKPINVLTNDLEKVLENEEIKLLLSAMNIVPFKYDSQKLRYGRLGIASDADADGGHIALLVTIALQYFAPEFIKEGRLVRLESPYYIVKKGGKEYYFTSEQDINIKGDIHLCKGLGSLSPEQAHRSMFTEEFQSIKTIKLDDEDIELLNKLMGKDTDFKKQYVQENIDFSQVRE